MGTRLGQRIDAAALDGRSRLTPEQVRDTDDLLETMDIASVVLLGGTVALVGALRGCFFLAAAVGVIGVANLPTQAMRRCSRGPISYRGSRSWVSATASRAGTRR